MTQAINCVLFRSRSGATLEVRNGILHSENVEEVKRALKEDLRGSWVDRQMAKSYLQLLTQAGL
jgi:hypothetical protein